jgi:hypothetical protein
LETKVNENEILPEENIVDKINNIVSEHYYRNLETIHTLYLPHKLYTQVKSLCPPDSKPDFTPESKKICIYTSICKVILMESSQTKIIATDDKENVWTI